MNKTMIALATLALTLAPNALAEGKSYKAKPFTQIDVDGAMKVVFKSAPTTSVYVESSNGDFSDSYIANRGDTLVVSRKSLNSKRSWFSWGGRSVSISDDGNVVKINGKTAPTYTVYVTGPELVGVDVAQSSRFESRTINAPSFEAQVSSSSTATLAGTATEARLSASSSGDINAGELSAGTLRASASSSGEVNAAVSGTGESSVNASSSGEVGITSASAASFEIDASSGASVEMSGSCAKLHVSASSGASVEGGELRCTNATVSASSGASVDAFASAGAQGNASSGGSVSFAGNPSQRDNSESSGGSVDFKS